MRGFVASAFALALTLGAWAQSPPGTVIKGEPVQVAEGISRTVSEIQARELIAYPQNRKMKEEEKVRLTVPEAFAPPRRVLPGLTYPNPNTPPDISTTGGKSRFSIGTTFLGIADSGVTIPPDTHGAVGPTQVCVVSNDRVKFLNKDGSAGPINVTLNSFFSGVGSDVFDPRAKFDRLSNRWYIVAVDGAFTEGSSVLFAVSSGATITNTSSFTFYSIENVAGEWFDYPIIGMDEDAVYVTLNAFTISGGSFTGADVFSIRKSTLPGALNVVKINVGGSDGFSLAPADNDRTSNSAGIIVSAGWSAGGVSRYVRFYTVNSPGTGADNLSLGNFVQLNDYGSIPGTDIVPQKGSANKFQANDDRLGGGTFMRRNPVTGTWTLWGSMNAAFNAAGTAVNGGSQIGVRWFEFDSVDAATPVIRQQGTLLTTDANGKYYWFPSIAANGQGHAVIGSSVADPTDPGSLYGSVNVAARLVGDSLGTLSFNSVGFSGLNTYFKTFGGGENRWGDYSEACIDPTDNQTMWVFQEYANSTIDTWATRVVKVLAPPPATPSTLSPNNANPGDTLNVTVTGTSSSGSAFYDPGAGFTNRIAAALGTGVTVNSVTFNNATSITLNITVAAGATPGARNLKVTNPDGQESSLASAFAVNSGTLSLTSISPTFAAAQSGDTVVQLTGTNFDNTTVGQWNGADRATTFINSTRIDMTVNAADLAFSGSGQIRAVKGMGTTSELTFTINSATFQISPSSVSTIVGTGKGTLSNVLASDNVYYTITGNAQGNGRGYEYVLEGNFALRPVDGTGIGFFFESRVASAVTTGNAVIEVYNWSTGKWQRFSTIAHPTTSDGLQGASGALNSAWVSPTKTLKSRIRVFSNELGPRSQTLFFDRFYVQESY